MAQLLDIRLNESVSPIDALDQAFVLLRRARAQHWLRGLAASLPLAAVLICLYALERAVGVRPSLPLFAALCALAYWARFHMLSGLAGELLSAATPKRSPLASLETAMVAGIGSCAWAACLIVAGQRSFFGMLACMPLLCVRGAIAPSLLARAACAPDAGTAALSRALADTGELRQVFVRVELLTLLGLLALFGNLYALLATALLVASSVLGLDVGFVSALIAPDNELVLLLLLGLATLLLEPLRAAISAVAFQLAQERSEASDLQAAIAALPQRRARGLSLLLLCALSVPGAARADEGDELARSKAQAILARSEFLPSAADSERGPVQAWLDRRLRERERELADHDLSTPARFDLRLPPLLVMSVAFVLMLGVAVWLTRKLRKTRSEAQAVARASLVPTRAEQLAEAARLARDGSYAESLRSLYAACLQALGHEQRLGHTNGQLLSQLSPGPLRAAFELLTSHFERCRYGRQALSQQDYEQASALAQQILQERAP